MQTPFIGGAGRACQAFSGRCDGAAWRVSRGCADAERGGAARGTVTWCRRTLSFRASAASRGISPLSLSFAVTVRTARFLRSTSLREASVEMTSRATRPVAPGRAVPARPAAVRVGRRGPRGRPRGRGPLLGRGSGRVAPRPAHGADAAAGGMVILKGDPVGPREDILNHTGPRFLRAFWRDSRGKSPFSRRQRRCPAKMAEKPPLKRAETYPFFTPTFRIFSVFFGFFRLFSGADIRFTLCGPPWPRPPGRVPPHSVGPAPRAGVLQRGSLAVSRL